MLFKYSGKYVNIYFNMKITFCLMRLPLTPHSYGFYKVEPQSERKRVPREGEVNPYLRHPLFKNLTVLSQDKSLSWLETVTFLNKGCLKYGFIFLLETTTTSVLLFHLPREDFDGMLFKNASFW